MIEPPPGPIQIQLPPVLNEMMQQWPLVLDRLAVQEAKATPSQAGLFGLLAVAAFAVGLLTMVAGLVAWAHWGG